MFHLMLYIMICTQYFLVILRQVFSTQNASFNNLANEQENKFNYLQFPAKKRSLSISGPMNILTGQIFHPVGTTLEILLEFS